MIHILYNKLNNKNLVDLIEEYFKNNSNISVNLKAYDGSEGLDIIKSKQNDYDVIVLDIIWFCHDKQFVFKGTEDMIGEYHNYWFHIKGFFIGELIALLVCAISSLIISSIL